MGEKSLELKDGRFVAADDTVEWSPVEPQFERKLYVRGIGEVEEG